MKKLFLSLVVVMMCATAMFAQSSLIATLSHEGNVQVFHGPTSYKQAMAAAQDGDIISLAGGIYEATNITKGITLRGSGVEKDTISNAYPTELQGTFTINIPDSCSSPVIEGVYCSSEVTLVKMKNPVFMKSKFTSLNGSSSDSMIDNLTMLHCNVTTLMALNSSSTANLINSYIYNLSGTSLDVTNCYVRTNPYYINKSQFRNCLIVSTYNPTLYYNSDFSTSNMIYNCVGANEKGYSIFTNHSANNNVKLTFSDFKALFTSTGFNQLTDVAKANYKGDDGTEVGLYGGSLPYDQHIAKPQITKCNIAQKTTADGKLSVDIEVRGVE
ncbi:MAG: hypothetical protein J6I52_07835 [Prevotella sp.]|nr:hypothetical protein [Prevotella sp.]